MRVTILASGSGGNATLIQAGGTSVLVDAGVGPRVVEARMRRALGSVVGIDAILLSHPHGDHVGQVEPCARAFDAPVFLAQATRRRMRLEGLSTRVFGRNTSFSIGALRVEPMPIPHDAPQVALVFEHHGARAALVTDLGHVPPGLAEHLAGCQLVLLESNHDPAMLAAGPYPDFLKKRIASGQGHLSNAQAAALLAKLGEETREVVLMHLSERCNSPMLALAEARVALRDRTVSLRAAKQDEPLDLAVRVPGKTGRARSTRLAMSQLPLPW